MERDERESRKMVVVGAGQIGTPVVRRLVALGHSVTWLSRTRPSEVPAGAQHVCVDARDPDAVATAAEGAEAVIAAVNPATYDADVWARELPPLHAGLIAGVGQSGARLVLLDALYLYETGAAPLSPDTPQTPSTAKGRVRKQLADMVAEAQRAGSLRATTLRAPDFWGPGLHSALITEQGLADLRRGKRPLVLGDPDVPHAFAHRDDVVDALVTLALADDSVLGHVFHAPVIHVSTRELVSTLSAALGTPVEPRVGPRWLLRVAGLFDASTRGLIEMLPQWERPYLVDDHAYCERFGVRATSLAEGVRQLAS
ncbi:MAG: NAD(P)H-binding protein [Sandaracinaceae bacterium]|nr:NAD(P)H-binding protein [Sandaracinaceae bacterium]